MTTPRLTDYLNIYLYLQDYYHFRKESEGSFSYESWAADLGVTSKSYLRFAILGKRTISEELAQKMANSMGFNEGEKEYFFLLVLYTQATQPDARKAYGKRLTYILKTQVAMDEVPPEPSLLGQPVYMTIRNILSFSDAPRSAEKLAEILNIALSSVESILQNLKAKGYVEHTELGWTACHLNVKVQEASMNEAILSYHRQTLLKAIEAQQSPSDERSYRSLGVPLSKEEYQEYLKDLDLFAKDVFAKYGKDSISSRRLYQINFNLFPWTSTVVT